MKLGGNRPPGLDALLFSVSGTGSLTHPVAYRYGWTYHGLRVPNHGPTEEVKVLWYEADMCTNRRPVGPQSTTPTTRPRGRPPADARLLLSQHHANNDGNVPPPPQKKMLLYVNVSKPLTENNYSATMCIPPPPQKKKPASGREPVGTTRKNSRENMR